MTTTVAFVRVVPDEIHRFGPAAAVVLAHIRFRCGSPGPGRIESGGRIWWRVTYGDPGREVGLSVKVVRGALDVLDGVVLANRFPPLSDQSRAFTVCREEQPSDQPSAPQGRPGKPSDQPSAPQGIPSAPEGISKCPTGQTPCLTGHLHYSPEELKDGEEARAPRDAPQLPPDSPPTANSELVRRRRPRCARHAHLPDDVRGPNCIGCGDLRVAAEQATSEAERVEAAERDRIRARINSCRDCDEYGRLDTLDDCPRHENFRQQRHALSVEGQA